MNSEIDECVKILKAKGTIIYPTDTVWGIGCDATQEEAVEKIYELKKRPAEKSFVVLVNGIDMLDRYLRNIPSVALELIEMSDKPQDLKPRTKAFALRIIRMYSKLPKNDTIGAHHNGVETAVAFDVTHQDRVIELRLQD